MKPSLVISRAISLCAGLYMGLGVLCACPVDAAEDAAPAVSGAPPQPQTPPQPQPEPQAQPEPVDWLARITESSRRLNYIGTFSYQSGRRFETSRIAHRFANGEERERLEVLDGSPREVIRQGSEVRWVLPAQHTVMVSHVSDHSSFPGRLPQSYAELVKSYHIREGELGRIAGHEAQQVVLEPRDDLRFGHVLWVEVQSGLLLKSQAVDAKGDVVEQFAFSDLRIGVDIGDEQLASQASPDADWRVIDVGNEGTEQAEEHWRLKTPLPGFSLVSRAYRHGGTEHMVFSDGLASISVFIEPVAEGTVVRGGYSGGGAVNAFECIVDGQRVTVLGEVPPRAVQHLSEIIERIRK
jgi:sigma-E factor negative regulatory protein RseB